MRRVVSSSASSRMPGSGGLEPRARPTPQPTPKRRLAPSRHRLAPTRRRLLADVIVRSDTLRARLLHRTHKSRRYTASPARYNPHSDDRFSSMGLYAECDQAASQSRASRPRTPHKVLCIIGHFRSSNPRGELKTRVGRADRSTIFDRSVRPSAARNEDRQESLGNVIRAKSRKPGWASGSGAWKSGIGAIDP